MILITGGAGFIGRNLALKLLADGESVVAVDRRRQDEFEAIDHPGYKIESRDLLDPAALTEVLETYRPKVVLALADAFVGPVEEWVGAGAALLSQSLRAARAAGVKRFCIASSLAVYMGVDGPFREDMPLPMTSPLHICAVKKAEEVLGHWYGANTDLEVVAMRFGNIYGPRYHSMMNTPSRYLFEGLGREVPADRPKLDLTVYEQVADFCHVDDCVAGISLIARAPKLNSRIYNIGAGQGATDAAVRRAVDRALGRNDVAAEVGVTNNYLDIGRLSGELGYRPQHDIDSGMAAYRAWLGTHPQ